MYLTFGNRVFEKDRTFAFVSFLAGLIFFGGFLYWIISFFSFETVVEQFTKLTSQSNLIAFFTAGAYFVYPNSKIFKTNFLPLFSVTILWFAGLGFWFILFPVYYIDLGSFLVSSKDEQEYAIYMFFHIWNHLVTQILFLIFFFYMNKKSNYWHLVPISSKSFITFLFFYLCGWIIWNVIISFVGHVFPTYGILTNFNPHTTYKGEDSFTSLFSLRSLIAAHLACLGLLLGISSVFSSLAIKFRMSNYYENTGKILRKPSKSFTKSF